MAVTEPIVEPDLAICDAHHHLWNRAGNCYLLPEYLADVDSGHNIVSSVFCESGDMYDLTAPPHLQPVGETRFAVGAAEEAKVRYGHAGICAGIVSFADLNLGAEVGEVLDAHMAVSPRFKGVRHCAAWDASDKMQNAPTNPLRQMMSSTQFMAGMAEVERRHLSFDAWVYHPQIEEVGTLAGAFPNTLIVLDHLGAPLGIGPYAGRRAEVFATWSQSMKAIAAHPNIVVKLGGICMPLNGWQLHKRETPPTSREVAQLVREYYLRAIDYFGVDRCLFQSNYPADRPSLTYRVLWNALKLITIDFSAAEKRAMFHDNAVRVYRLPSPP